MTEKLNRYSSRITQPRSQGASQAMLYGTGMTTADMDKPQIGIASVWYEGNTCNMHLLDLAAKVKEGVVAAGMVVPDAETCQACHNPKSPFSSPFDYEARKRQGTHEHLPLKYSH